MNLKNINTPYSYRFPTLSSLTYESPKLLICIAFSGNCLEIKSTKTKLSLITWIISLDDLILKNQKSLMIICYFRTKNISYKNSFITVK